MWYRWAGIGQFGLLQMLGHLLLDEAGETTWRHLSPTPVWDVKPGVKLLHIDNFAALALSQAEADESSTRMLRPLEAAGVARVEPSTDALLGFEVAESGTCWRPSHWLFESWPLVNVVALALKSAVPSDAQRNISVRITTCFCSIFQYAARFATHFEGRVGRGWTSVRREFRTAWALLLLANGDLSRPWDTTVHAPDASLRELRLSLLRSPWSRVWVQFRKVGDSRGQCVLPRNHAVLWTRGSAPSDLGLLNLTDYRL